MGNAGLRRTKVKSIIYIILSSIILCIAVSEGIFIITQMPGDVSAVKGTADTLLSHGKPYEAARQYEEYLQQRFIKKNRRAKIHYLIGVIYQDAAGNPVRAYAHFEHASQLGGVFNDIGARKVRCLEMMGCQKSALKEAAEYTDLNPFPSKKKCRFVYHSNVYTDDDYILWKNSVVYTIDESLKEKLFIIEAYYREKALESGQLDKEWNAVRVGQMIAAGRTVYDAESVKTGNTEMFTEWINKRYREIQKVVHSQY